MAKFNETSQEASLGVPLQKYNKESWLINNNSNKMTNFLYCLKNPFKTTSPNSMKPYRKLSWVTFYKNTRGYNWSTTTTTTTTWPTSCFALKKKHLWNYQARFTETFQEASLHASLAYTPRPLFEGWNMLIVTSMSMKYPLGKEVFKLQHCY